MCDRVFGAPLATWRSAPAVPFCLAAADPAGREAQQHRSLPCALPLQALRRTVDCVCCCIAHLRIYGLACHGVYGSVHGVPVR